MKSFTDHRGVIHDFGNGVQIIETFKGKSRANHFHLSSGHDAYLSKGALDYYERPVNSHEKPKKLHIVAPAFFSTGPMVEHTMAFTEDSSFTCVRTGGSYTQEEYEKDIVRFSHNLEEIYNSYDMWDLK